MLSDALSKRKYTTLWAKCSVSYHGRGASRLGPGDRMIVIKPDGAVLVHRPTGYSPVNWQPSSQALSVENSDNLLVIRSVRGRPRETLEIYLEQVYAIVIVESMIDSADFIEYLDEAEIRDYLAAHPEEIEEGLHVIRKERPIGEGYADIVARDKEGKYVVIEVKRVTANREAVAQLQRYVEHLRSENPGAPVRGILVAPSITKDAQALLNSLGLEYRRIDVAKIYKKAVEQGELQRVAKTTSLLDFLRGKRPEK